MAKSLTQINKQIASLQKEVERLKSKEMGGVIARIREAISHYGLTHDDIFGAGAARKASGGKTRGRKAGTSKAAKAPLPPKFHDGAGSTWSGHGKRPNWFKDLLAAGKTPDELLVK